MLLLCEHCALSRSFPATTVACIIKTLQNNLISSVCRADKTVIRKFVAFTLPYD